MKTYNFMVGKDKSGHRLDVFLVEADLGLSRRRIRSIIDVGGVYVNGKRVRIASRQVSRGDKIRVEYSEGALRQLKTQDLGFTAADLLYDALGVVAVNKPPGMPSQATRDQSILHVVTCLESFYKAQEPPRQRRFILVHRLDKETSGVLLVAEGNKTATWLTEQFRSRLVDKTYLAICHGIPAQQSFTEKAFLSEIDKRTGDVRVVHAGGRSAVTHFTLRAVNKTLGLSLIECHPETGRSHQIRVHLAINGLPIVGDKRYHGAPSQGGGGGRSLPPELGELAALHHFLHAQALRFVPAAGLSPVDVTAPPPPRFAQFLLAAALVPGASL